ncbi:cyclophilin 1 short isoform [Mytilinidion resinicola]|uniref:Peptidyl-prolyl cis-trans isomerase n=1 Tax=Mytilinidion resinicola TaxID=574789 RepID=A0A6A6YPJ8_9PEZI|nr:cyclophilin 1 short isoform [Mytilinidion resinicola]KAF2810448.1 cyclophilin 1 short isoform [Mytilinidion resinicola]
MVTKCFFDCVWTGPEVGIGPKNDVTKLGDVKNQFGRIIFLLLDEIALKTTENFRVLCTGERGFSYRGSKFDRIIPQYMLQGGDIAHYGTGVYGQKFPDDQFGLQFNQPFLLCMSNTSPGTNSSQFIITTTVTSGLNNKYIMFGYIAYGDADSVRVIRAIEACGSNSGSIKYSHTPTITSCGQI